MIALETPLMKAGTDDSGSVSSPMFIVIPAGETIELTSEHLNKVLYLIGEDEYTGINIPNDPLFTEGTDFELVNAFQNPISVNSPFIYEKNEESYAFPDSVGTVNLLPYTYGRITRITDGASYTWLWIYNESNVSGGKTPMFINLAAGETRLLGTAHINKILYVSAADDTAKLVLSAPNPAFFAGIDFDFVNISTHPVKIDKVGSQDFVADETGAFMGAGTTPILKPFSYGKLARVSDSASTWLYHDYTFKEEPSGSSISPTKLWIGKVGTNTPSVASATYKNVGWTDETITAMLTYDSDFECTILGISFQNRDIITPDMVVTPNLVFNNGMSYMITEILRGNYPDPYIFQAGFIFRIEAWDGSTDPVENFIGGTVKIEKHS